MHVQMYIKIFFKNKKNGNKPSKNFFLPVENSDFARPVWDS